MTPHPLLLTLIRATITGIALLMGIIAGIDANRKPAKAVLSVYVVLLVASLVLLSINIEREVNIHALAKWPE